MRTKKYPEICISFDNVSSIKPKLIELAKNANLKIKEKGDIPVEVCGDWQMFRDFAHMIDNEDRRLSTEVSDIEHKLSFDKADRIRFRDFWQSVHGASSVVREEDAKRFRERRK